MPQILKYNFILSQIFRPKTNPTLSPPIKPRVHCRRASLRAALSLRGLHVPVRERLHAAALPRQGRFRGRVRGQEQYRSLLLRRQTDHSA